MLLAARGLLETEGPDTPGAPEALATAFQERFIDTGRFFDRFVGASQWQYFQAAHGAAGAVRDRDEARRRVEEAQLFIEAAHACYTRLREAQAAAGGASPVREARP
jgi:sulfite reductase (ferredoxin)